MDCSISYQDNVGVISLEGRLDTEAAPHFDAWFAEQDRLPCRGYLLDMSGMSYLTSAGLRSMLKLLKRMEARGGKLAFCAMNPPVLDLFRMAGFTSLLSLYESREDALAALAA